MHAGEIAPDLWVLDFEVVQAYVVTGDDGAVLVDTGVNGQADPILDFLATLERPLLQIVLTHAHKDHAGNAAVLQQATGAPLIASAPEAAFLAGEAEIPPPILADWERPIFDAVFPGIPDAPHAVADAIVA